MSKRRSNKSVKRMICDTVNTENLNCESWIVWSRPYFIDGKLCCWFNGNCILESKVEELKQGTISLTASELKGE